MDSGTITSVSVVVDIYVNVISVLVGGAAMCHLANFKLGSRMRTCSHNCATKETACDDLRPLARGSTKRYICILCSTFIKQSQWHTSV